jgi:hypothetical protein
MWKIVLLKIFYYLFFVVVFLFAILVFFRIVNFYFGIPGLKDFLTEIISRVRL